MGRALKIQKTNPGAGNSGASVNVDQGFPNFGSLTNPVYNTPVQTLDSNQFLGVVGGSDTDSTASVTFPEIVAVANVALANGTNTTYGTARIVRQKGSHKFLVTYNGSATTAGSFITGQAYKILSVGTTTDWNAVGHGDGNAAVGDEFTATAAGSGNGTAYPMGICVLSNTATPAAGFMSIQYSTGDSTAVYASYITNKWVRDWNGMTYGNYADTNYGVNVQSSENQYVANFFTDEGNVTVSGGSMVGTTSVQNATIQLAQINNVTS
jgi:hypothetical protein